MTLEKIRVMMIIGRMGDGGKERQLLLLLETLKHQQEIITILMVMNAGGEREMEASKFADELVVLFGRSKIDLISPVIKLCKLIKNENIGLIHTWGSGIWDLIGLIGGRLCHIPVLHNGIRSAPDQMNIYNHVTRISARFADAAVANSNAGLTAFDLTSYPHAKVIYNGLDFSRFEGIRIEDEGQDLCMVANFREGKDHRCLILAMPEILKRFPQASLTLVGHDYGTLIETQSLVNELQISNNVGFVTDCMLPEPIIGKSQIGILVTNVSAHGEGISNALLEYMALSKPVIATDNGGNPEVVFDNGTGFLVPPGSHEAISEKVIYLLENPSVAKEMGKRGKSSVNERFSLEKMEKDYIELYTALSQVSNPGG